MREIPDLLYVIFTLAEELLAPIWPTIYPPTPIPGGGLFSLRDRPFSLGGGTFSSYLANYLPTHPNPRRRFILPTRLFDVLLAEVFQP